MVGKGGGAQWHGHVSMWRGQAGARAGRGRQTGSPANQQPSQSREAGLWHAVHPRHWCCSASPVCLGSPPKWGAAGAAAADGWRRRAWCPTPHG